MQQNSTDITQQHYDGATDSDAPLSPGAHIGQVHQSGGGKTTVTGGRFDFEDGGTYCGGWEDSKAHGHGVCTGPKNQGAYSGAWHYGFEVSGVYVWPSGSSFEGHWQNGKRHGLGVETRGRWVYRGEWTQGYKGRYGVRQSATSTAKYEGTWANGLQDGYGSETYADGGTYQGQWMRGMRHGYGVRQSAPFGLASRFRPKNRGSMTSLRSNDGTSSVAAPTPDPAEKRTHRIDDARGGFVLKARSDDPPPRRNSLVEKTRKGLLSGLKIRKQKSTGELEKKGMSGSIRSTASSASWISTESSLSNMTNKSLYTDSNASFVVEDEHLDGSVTETYMGEWKNDKRCGYGISERSDGLRYEGEWFNNKKYGYGVTTFRDGTKEEGKYKNNILITSQKKKHLFLIRSSKFRERIDAAVNSAQRASKYALQKADIAISRTATSRGKAESADLAADHARVDSDVAIATAREFAPDFKPALLERFERIRIRDRFRTTAGAGDPDIGKTNLSQFDQPILDKQISHGGQNSQKIPMQNNLKSEIYNQTNQQQTPPNTSLQQNSPRRPSLQKNQQLLSPPNIPYAQQNYNNSPKDYNQSSIQFTQPQPPGIYPEQNNSFVDQHQLQSYSPNSGMSSLQQQSSDYNPVYGNGFAQQSKQMLQQQQSPIHQHQEETERPGPATIRRNSRLVSDSGRPLLGAISQSSIDYFDHYKRPPSRDSSIDRYTRAASRLGGSRQPSVDRTIHTTATLHSTPRESSVGLETPPERSARAGSQFRGTTPVPSNINGSVPTGLGSRAGTPSFGQTVVTSPTPQSPFEDVILRQRTLGQDIVPSLNQPKRTESLYLGSIKAPLPVQPNSVVGRSAGGGGGRGRGIKDEVVPRR
uniref:CSON005461 protein n=1 Tax=Culicoides sonorensis TaxID=179676 RepID=A0A336LV77_CULSO